MKKKLRCILGKHRTQDVRESKYKSRHKIDWEGYGKWFYDSVCLDCGNVTHDAQDAKKFDEERDVVLEAERLRTKQIWFDSLSEDERADAFVDFMDKK